MIRAVLVIASCDVAMLLALLLAPGLTDLTRVLIGGCALVLIVALALLGRVLHDERSRAEQAAVARALEREARRRRRDADALRAIDALQQRGSRDGGEIR